MRPEHLALIFQRGVSAEKLAAFADALRGAEDIAAQRSDVAPSGRNR